MERKFIYQDDVWLTLCYTMCAVTHFSATAQATVFINHVTPTTRKTLLSSVFLLPVNLIFWSCLSCQLKVEQPKSPENKCSLYLFFERTNEDFYSV